MNNPIQIRTQISSMENRQPPFIWRKKVPMLAACSYSKKMRMRDCKYCFPYSIYCFSYGYCFSACIAIINFLYKPCTLVCQLLVIVYYIIFVFIILIIASRISNILLILNWEINSRILGMVGNMIWPVFIIEF